MNTYECVAKSGNTGKEIVVLVRATSSSSASTEAKKQAMHQFGPNPGSVTIISVKEK